MSRFIAEYRVNDASGSGVVTALVPFEAETLQIAQREVERLIAASKFDEAVLYQAVSVSSTSRNVSTTPVNGQPKVIIGSALTPTSQDAGERPAAL